MTASPSPSAPRQVPPSPWNLPNLLTVIRILLVPIFFWLLVRENGVDDSLRIQAFAIFAIASLTDKADGSIARRRGLVTDFGKMLDPIADKALMGAAFIGLSLLELLPWWITIVVLGREALITLMRFVLVRRAVIPASKGGKLKTFLQAIALGLLILPWEWTRIPGLVIMGAAVIVTVVTGVDYLLRGWRIWKTTSPPATR